MNRIIVSQLRGWHPVTQEEKDKDGAENLPVSAGKLREQKGTQFKYVKKERGSNQSVDLN